MSYQIINLNFLWSKEYNFSIFTRKNLLTPFGYKIYYFDIACVKYFNSSFPLNLMISKKFTSKSKEHSIIMYLEIKNWRNYHYNYLKLQNFIHTIFIFKYQQNLDLKDY